MIIVCTLKINSFKDKESSFIKTDSWIFLEQCSPTLTPKCISALQSMQGIFISWRRPTIPLFAVKGISPLHQCLETKRNLLPGITILQLNCITRISFITYFLKRANNYMSLRNSRNERNTLSQGSTHQITIRYQIVISGNIHTGNII